MCLEMASKSSASAAHFFLLNLLFFALTNATYIKPCPPLPTPKPKPYPPPPSPKPKPCPPPPSPKPKPCPPPPSPEPKPCPGSCGTPTPTTPTTPTPPSSNATCPRDALKLGACTDLLGMVKVIVGSPPTLPCCSLLQGLADLEAAVCLCTAIKANVLGTNLNIPVSLSLILNNCGRRLPTEFRCA